ncbi:MAG: aconitate hydratase [Rhodospirillaceae bacterium]
MGRNLLEKIVAPHLTAGEMRPGCEVGIAVDQTLTQDALGTMAYLQLEGMGVDRIRTKLSISYVDHLTLQSGFENADDHRYLQTVAQKYGVLYSKPGNGICHQVHLERFSRPGWTLIGSDSHTPTCGAVGMLAIGAGGLDVAAAMAGEAFHFTYPRVVRVNLSGALRPWSTAKDAVLEILRRLTTKGNVGKVLEFGGEGLAGLSVPERATIANMGAELGITTSIFPSDAVTRQFLQAQQRAPDWVELTADADAAYDAEMDLDLAAIEPNVALPHSPGNVRTVRQAGNIAVDQVLVGSCTNASYRDLMVVAAMLKGKRVHPDVSFGVAAGSRQVLRMIAANGALNDIIDSGARILETACGFCVGFGQSPRSGGVSVRTNNRNFEGRSGTLDAQVYLVSPEVAVATALRGRLTDPRDLGMAYPRIDPPQAFAIDDAMILPPPESGEVEIFRGPNIGQPYRRPPLPQSLRATVAAKVGDGVTTDHILPSGPVGKFRSNIAKSSEFLFRDAAPRFIANCAANAAAGAASAIAAGAGYGEGSSREHAASCPAYLGVRLVLAKSIQRIHMSNLVNFGVLPLVFAAAEDGDRLRDGDTLLIENLRAALEAELVTVRNLTTGEEIAARHELSPRQIAYLFD